jgi:hypothetical protein
VAITERYVRQDAAGGGDGTTDANSGANGAFTWAEMITDINTPRAGYRYNVKYSATKYSLSATTTLTGDGTTTAPNIIRGFNSTPGDLDAVGRSSGGALDTTNFPWIEYNSTYYLNAGGADYLVIQNLKVTGARSGSLLSSSATGGAIVRCYVENTQNNAAAGGVILQATNGGIVDCDVFVTGTSHDYAINPTSGTCYVIGCRAKAAAGIGIKCAQTATLIGNTIYECVTGIDSSSTTNTPRLYSNTVVGCTTGIKFVASTTGACQIINNHITDCTTAIDWQTSTCAKLLAFNRTRDNTSGAVNGGGDWETGTTVDHVTSDDTDALDFTDASTDDYSLKAGAPATSKGPGYLVDIGANGTPVVTAGATQGFVIGG